MQGAWLHLRGRRQSERHQLGRRRHAAARRGRNRPHRIRCDRRLRPRSRDLPFISKLAREGFPIVTWHVLPAEGTVEGLKAATGEDIPNAGANAAIAIGEKLGGKGTSRSPRALERHREPDVGFVPQEMAEKYPGHQDARYPDGRLRAVRRRGQGGRHPPGQPGRQRRLLDHRQRHPDLVGRRPQGRSRGRHHRHGLHPPEPRHRQVRRAYGIVAQPLYEESAKTAELLAALAEGKAVRTSTRCRRATITAADLEPYYKILDSAGQ